MFVARLCLTLKCATNVIYGMDIINQHAYHTLSQARSLKTLAILRQPLTAPTPNLALPSPVRQKDLTRLELPQLFPCFCLFNFLQSACHRPSITDKRQGPKLHKLFLWNIEHISTCLCGQKITARRAPTHDDARVRARTAMLEDTKRAM